MWLVFNATYKPFECDISTTLFHYQVIIRTKFSKKYNQETITSKVILRYAQDYYQFYSKARVMGLAFFVSAHLYLSTKFQITSFNSNRVIQEKWQERAHTHTSPRHTRTPACHSYIPPPFAGDNNYWYKFTRKHCRYCSLIRWLKLLDKHKLTNRGA